MSRKDVDKCDEEIGRRVGRVGRGCYKDAIATRPQQLVRVGIVEFGERHDTRTDGQHRTTADRRPTNRVSAWQAERESRPTRPTSS